MEDMMMNDHTHGVFQTPPYETCLESNKIACLVIHSKNVLVLVCCNFSLLNIVTQRYRKNSITQYGSTLPKEVSTSFGDE